MESIQKRLTRERPPRVKITYDVETLGSAVKTELPFVMGIIADLSGDRTRDRGKAFGAGSKIPEYEERDFVFISDGLTPHSLDFNYIRTPGGLFPSNHYPQRAVLSWNDGPDGRLLN